MGDMAEYYEGLAMEQEIDYIMSQQMQSRIKRYDIKDDEIKEFLFTVSVKQLCQLVDKIIMEFDMEEVTETEMDKMIDIAAKGLVMKSLSIKQTWCIGAFVAYHLKYGRHLEK